MIFIIKSSTIEGYQIYICEGPNTKKVVYFWRKKMRFLLTEDLNKLSNDTKLIKIEVILLKVQILQSVYFFLFSIYFAHYFVH